MTRPPHHGRPAPAPFADDPVAAAQTVAERALPERCRFGPLTVVTSPTPPYGSTSTVDPVASDVPCLVEGDVDRPVTAGDDPSHRGLFDLRIPHGNALQVDHAVEITDGRNTGLVVQVIWIHDSTTEPLLRATCEQIDGGNP